ncbi:MAG: Arm DNA-binding domain-containing protein [Desulfovibrio sp.]|jgi:hypothetical protein|nr:Arm DNA-binding domain-containing protein [Desulfovibrio sp.]
MYLEVAPGGGKWWRLKYRLGGKEKRISLGVYPDVGLKEARLRRDAAREMIVRGIDPSEQKKADRAAAEAAAREDALTFEDVRRFELGKHHAQGCHQKKL